MPVPETKIATYLELKDLMKTFPKGKLILPVSYLKDQKNLNKVFNDLINQFEPVEAIQYSSFLNMISQVTEVPETIDLTKRELRYAKISKNIPRNKILFHRDILLYFVSKIISLKVNGNNNITGNKNLEIPRNYYFSLMLANQQLSHIHAGLTIFIKNYLIRGYPYAHLPKLTFTIYSSRIQRYWYIYTSILNGIKDKNKDMLLESISLIEKKVGINLNDYFLVVAQVIFWYLQLPTVRKEDKDNKFKNTGFIYGNLNSFYIDKNNFKSEQRFIKLVNHLSLNLNGFTKYFSKVRPDKIDNYFFLYVQSFFDFPVFRIKEGQFCIIDLKLLVDGVCGGFFFKLLDVNEKQRLKISEQYGYLLEEYFTELLNNIFETVAIPEEKKVAPDAIIETKNHILIFEFTTERYRFASLYNIATDDFFEDLDKIFFNTPTKDKNVRGKTVEGKFFQLNKYVGHYKQKNKKIIPLLVTENKIGDYDLLNQLNKYLEKNIAKNNLNNLVDYKPLIISLDDLEIFWALCEKQEAINKFIQCIEDWDTENKGPYHYDFGYYINSKFSGAVVNNDYKKFFNFMDFLLKLK